MKLYFESKYGKLYQGNALEAHKIPETAQCIVTSPPYWGQRNYDVDNQLGIEDSPELYTEHLCDILEASGQILNKNGILWLNLGDTYKASGNVHVKLKAKNSDGVEIEEHYIKPQNNKHEYIKEKSLVGIPWRTAFEMQKRKWLIRQENIWCLSGGAYVYARTHTGDSPMMIRELLRLKPNSVKLWNGSKWTRLLGISKTVRKSNEIELVLRSGERISCTPTHKFPTNKGLLEASNIKIGDILERVVLPEPENPLNPIHITEDAMWFAGLYLAEGSRSNRAIQIAGHAKEIERWNKLQKIVVDYGGNITRTVSGNCMDIRIYGKILHALIDHLVSGKIAKNKCVAPIVWKYSNNHLEAMLDGYLSGDGYWEECNNRWRLCFTRNYNLERDLRTICARLNYHLVLNLSISKCNGKDFTSFKGELRKTRSGHFNEKNTCEVVKIQKARCRELYDIGVEDEPHLFALSSGVLTHNSKPNPMPESVKDRLTNAHEHVFMLTKNKKYYFNHRASLEKSTGVIFGVNNKQGKGSVKYNEQTMMRKGSKQCYYFAKDGSKLRHGRDVWQIPLSPNKHSHIAPFPLNLVCKCIKISTKEHDVVFDPFMGSGTTAIAAESMNRKWIGIELKSEYCEIIKKRIENRMPLLFNT